MSARRRLLSAGVAAVALAGAWIVTETAPSGHDWLEPLPVTAAVGDEAVGRNLAATVHGATAAEVVVDDLGAAIETGGVWVVVDASARAVVTERASTLGGTRLIVGDVEYSPTDRVDRTLVDGSPPVGIDLRGPLVFELPDVPAEAELRLAGSADGRGDSVLVFPLAFETGEVEASVTLPATALETR